MTREERGPGARRGKRSNKKKKKKTAESLSLPKTLHINQFIVPTFETGQFLMRAALNDLALVEDVDDIGLLNGTQSVSHSDSCPASGSGIECCLHDLFRFRVQGGSGFVE